jgi:hypothetical protein
MWSIFLEVGSVLLEGILKIKLLMISQEGSKDPQFVVELKVTPPMG